MGGSTYLYTGFCTVSVGANISIISSGICVWFFYGNESNESILEAYGIVTKDKKLSDALKPKQCPNCNEPNKPDSKFCVKCRMVLTYDAYNETVEEKQDKDREVQSLKEQMRLMQDSQTEILALLKEPAKLMAALNEK